MPVDSRRSRQMMREMAGSNPPSTENSTTTVSGRILVLNDIVMGCLQAKCWDSEYHTLVSSYKPFHVQNRWRLVRELGQGGYGMVV